MLIDCEFILHVLMSQADKVLKRVQGDLTVSTHSDIPPQMGAIQRVILDDIFTVLRSG